ncbi:MAG: DUF4965 domain-containing protein [Clostridia bacterium]|nr:DUF4965 domain-containing protein [Clostridia bacterium]
MQLRAPAYPLITVDPYFSVWSPSNKLNESNTVHWTNSPNTISGVATVDGKKYRVIGNTASDIPAMKQISSNCTAFSTIYTFEEGGARLTLTFSTPLLITDLALISRPVSYLEIKNESADGKRHDVKFELSVSEEICINLLKEEAVESELIDLGTLKSAKIGSKAQKILCQSGDDVRINWGYFYLTTSGKAWTAEQKDEADGSVISSVGATVEVKDSTLITFAYDDVSSIEYFGKHLNAYWKKDGSTILDQIKTAHKDYKTVMNRCNVFAKDMFCDAVRAGGEKYAEILELAYRQVIAAHKLVLDTEGNPLFISKECFSNGCAATVDVTYPSTPLFLIYNPELVKAMLRPIYKYARSEEWTFDFAPHDVGQYPLLNGQVYGENALHMQMPVEECGNMIIMEAAIALATKSTSFADEHFELLETWVKYLIENGKDPENQLCTDDFAGHLAHNCNLSLKAIMGIASLGILYGLKKNKREERKYLSLARAMADDWAKRASNGDGSYRLAFDKPDTFSMKYNIVWDKLFGTDIMSKTVIESEFASYRSKIHPYGLPLDSRMPYTKSDWLVWTATLTDNRDAFIDFVEPLWTFYNYSPSRVPMTDWYYTITGEHRASRSSGFRTSFRNRTVQGGLFIKLMEYKQSVKYKK